MRLGVTAPRKALEEALALSDPERRNVSATMIVSQWANDAPSEAMAAVERVPDPALRSTLRDTVLRSWRDPESLAAYLRTLDPASRLAALSGGALYGVMQADPRRAAEIVAELPPGPEQRNLLMQVGTSYAQRDADAAFAWAQSLDTPDPELTVAILHSVAFKDPVRAFDLAGSVAEPMRSRGYSVALGVPTDAAQFSGLANRVLRLQEDQTRTRLVVSLIDSWARRPGNIVPALDWMLANGTAVPAEAFERIGLLYAHSDPGAAAAYVNRVPNGARAAWISAVAARMRRSIRRTRRHSSNGSVAIRRSIAPPRPWFGRWPRTIRRLPPGCWRRSARGVQTAPAPSSQSLRAGRSVIPPPRRPGRSICPS